MKGPDAYVMRLITLQEETVLVLMALLVVMGDSMRVPLLLEMQLPHFQCIMLQRKLFQQATMSLVKTQLVTMQCRATGQQVLLQL